MAADQHPPDSAAGPALSSAEETERSRCRARARSARDRLTVVDRLVFNLAIDRALRDSTLVSECTAAIGYRSFKSEASIEGVLQLLLQSGCRVYLPRVAGPAELEICEVTDLAADCRPGPFGIAEPETPVIEVMPEVSLIFVPGVAFDSRGGRLGFGMGYYDRLLARLSPGSVRIGVAFECQLMHHIPTAPWDQPLDWLVTETGLRRTHTFS